MIKKYEQRYIEIESTLADLSYWQDLNRVDRVAWQKFTKFTINALNIISITLGVNSIHYMSLSKVNAEFKGFASSMELAKGIFLAAKEDYINGYYKSEYSIISGEIFGSFINLAKEAIKENKKDVAIVLACAALEDSLKNYAKMNDVDVENKDMTEVIHSLKSKGLVSGAQKTLLDIMPKIRNYAMHANWDKITIEDANSVLGFVEQFVIERF